MVIIAYEGNSDGDFFNDLLEVYKLPKEVLFYDFEGKDNILNSSHKHYDEIEQKHIDKIDAILLVVDADNKKDKNPNRGYEASKKALIKLIDDLSFDVRVDYHIMCDEKKEGNLESFLLSVLDDEQRKCFERFKICYKYELSDKLVCNTFYKQMNHPFDYNHPNFKELKDKLINLFEEQ